MNFSKNCIKERKIGNAWAIRLSSIPPLLFKADKKERASVFVSLFFGTGEKIYDHFSLNLLWNGVQILFKFPVNFYSCFNFSKNLLIRKIASCSCSIEVA
jgi:hypothetical protein